LPGTHAKAYLASSSVRMKKVLIAFCFGVSAIKPFFFITEDGKNKLECLSY